MPVPGSTGGQEFIDAIDAPVDFVAFRCVVVVRPQSLNVHQMEEARTLDELIQHSDGQ